MNIVHEHSKKNAMLCYFYFQAVGTLDLASKDSQ